MKISWNEMNASQKRETIVLIVLTAIAAIFFILDLIGKWPNYFTQLALCVLSLFEGVVGWNKNRKLAIMEFVAAAFFGLAFFTVTFI